MAITRNALLISGPFTAGKTTLAATLAIANPSWAVRGFAYTLKNRYCEVNGVRITPENKELHRVGMQEFGDAGKRLYGDDYWARTLIESTSKSNLIIDDWRFPAEAKYFRDMLGPSNVLTVKLILPLEVIQDRFRRRAGRYPTKVELTHPSENSLREFHAEIVIDATLTQEGVVSEFYRQYNLLRYDFFTATLT